MVVVLIYYQVPDRRLSGGIFCFFCGIWSCLPGMIYIPLYIDKFSLIIFDILYIPGTSYAIFCSGLSSVVYA